MPESSTSQVSTFRGRLRIQIAKEEPACIYQAAASAEKVCDFLEIERYRHEPLLAQEQEVAVEPVAVPVRTMPEMGIGF